jgi:hypothetical protein
MKKFIAPLLGLLLVAGLFSADVGFAAMIDAGDRPENLTEATVLYDGSFRTALTTIVNYFLFFLGLIAVIMVIYGGLLYITAGGDDAGAEKGKKILLYAAVGIIVVLISYALVNTLLGAGSIEEPETHDTGSGTGAGSPSGL